MAKQDGTRNSKDTESASSADNLGSADGTYTKVVRYCARPAAKFSSKADWELWIMHRLNTLYGRSSIYGLCDLTHMPKRLRLLMMTEGRSCYLCWTTSPFD